MDLTSAATKIVKEQQSIIGPLAIEQARKVAGLQVSNNGDVTIVGDSKNVLSNLVNQYAKFFGQVSVEVCKDAVRHVNPPVPSEELPDILK